MAGVRRAGLMGKVSGVLDLPQDTVQNLTRTTVIGDVQLLLENHEGILEYTGERVRIKTSQGELIVTGKGLRIGSVFREEIAIDGRLEGVEFKR